MCGLPVLGESESSINTMNSQEGHIRTWQLYDYCSWARDSSFLKDRRSTEIVLQNTKFSTSHHGLKRLCFSKSLPDKCFQITGCKLLYSKCNYSDYFLSISRKQVDSRRQKHTSSLLLCKGTLPMKCKNPLPRHQSWKHQPTSLRHFKFFVNPLCHLQQKFK